MAGTIRGLDSGPGVQQREREKGREGLCCREVAAWRREENGPHFHAREPFKWLHVGVGPCWQLELSGAEAEGGYPRPSVEGDQSEVEGSSPRPSAKGEQSEAEGNQG